MEISIKKKNSPSFQKIVVLKRAEKAFDKFQQLNNIGSQIDKDIFERYLQKTIELEEKKPSNIIIDYIQMGRSKSKKLVIAIGASNKKLTKPQVLRSGLNKKTPIVHETRQETLTSAGIPHYLQQIDAYTEATTSFEKVLSKNPYADVFYHRILDY